MGFASIPTLDVNLISYGKYENPKPHKNLKEASIATLEKARQLFIESEDWLKIKGDYENNDYLISELSQGKIRTYDDFEFNFSVYNYNTKETKYFIIVVNIGIAIINGEEILKVAKVNIEELPSQDTKTVKTPTKKKSL
jgi:hypothetical protein